jgi:hypothetical protein
VPSHLTLPSTPPIISCREAPFSHDDYMVTIKKIVDRDIHFPKNFSKSAIDLINQLTNLVPSRRIGETAGGFADLKGHSFFKDFDWESMQNRKLPSPITIRLVDNKDRQNILFDGPKPKTLPYDGSNDPFKDF